MLQYIKKGFYKELHVGYPLVTCGKATRIDAKRIRSEASENAMKTQRRLRPHTQSGKMPGRGQ